MTITEKATENKIKRCIHNADEVVVSTYHRGKPAVEYIIRENEGGLEIERVNADLMVFPRSEKKIVIH